MPEPLCSFPYPILRDGEWSIVPCNMRTCPGCGPRWVTRYAEHYAARMAEDGRPIYAQVVSYQRWATLSERLRRGGTRRRVADAGAHRYVTIPLDDGTGLVLSTYPRGGTLVADPRAALADALTRCREAAPDRCVASSQCWSITAARSAEAPAPRPP